MDEIKNITDLNNKDNPQNSDFTFYLQPFGGDRHAAFDRAACVQSVDAEIVMLRVTLSEMFEQNSHDFKSIRYGILALDRLVRTRHQLSSDGEQGLAERMANILTNVDLPPGITGAILRK
jgi:hypothetical protein